LSTIFLNIFGNDTIDRYPLPYKGRLIKLLCISKAVFKELVLTAREFFVEPVYTEYLDTPAQEKEPLPKRPQLLLSNNREDGYLEYTPSRIWSTRDSKFWRWRRVNEWWREYNQDEYLNEKRHILL